METWDKADFFALLHDSGAGLFLEEVLLAKDVDEDWRNLFVLDGFLNCRYLVLDDVKGLFSLGFSFWDGVCSTECADNGDLVFILFLSDFDGLKHFYLVLGIKSITRLDFHRGRAQLAHSGQILIKMRGQFLNCRLGHGLSREPNSQSLIIDIHIPLAIELHLILFGPISHEYGMRMGIHKPRQHAVF